MSRKHPQTYTASIARLKALVAELERGDVDVDEMEAVVKESVELITTCRTRLRATQASVDTLLSGLLEEPSAPPQPVVSTTNARSDPDESDPIADE